MDQLAVKIRYGGSVTRFGLADLNHAQSAETRKPTTLRANLQPATCNSQPAGGNGNRFAATIV